MKAAVFEKPETMVVQEVDLAECGPGDIIIKVHACGICGGDIRNFSQGLRHGITRQIMGHEFSGTISATGTHVQQFSPGDRVAVAPDVSCGTCCYCQRGWVNLCLEHKMLGTHWPGGFAEYVHIPETVRKRGFIHPVPGGVDLDQACLSEPASSVIASQERAGISVGHSVLILGDGPLGCLHAEIARANGAGLVIMSGLARLKEAVRFSPDLLIDAAGQDVAAMVKDATAGLGVDVAICANPVAATQTHAVEAVRRRGRVVLFGGLPKQSPMTSLNSNTIHYNELEVVGAFSYAHRHHLAALQAIRAGLIHPEKYFNKTVSLDNIGEGFTAARSGSALKVLVKP